MHSSAPSHRSVSGEYEAGLAFTRVHTPSYPLFREPQYLLSLANTIVLLSRELHSTSSTRTTAFRTRPPVSREEILAPRTAVPIPRCRNHHDAARHNITLLGSDPSYSETVASRSISLTVSRQFRQPPARYYAVLPIKRTPRQSELSRMRRAQAPRSADLRAKLCPPSKTQGIIHLRLQALKRGDAVVGIFQRCAKTCEPSSSSSARADSPRHADGHEYRSGCDVEALGEQTRLSAAVGLGSLRAPVGSGKLGLAALEAMACEVPVVASRVGGLPEVVEDGVSGLLCDPEDIEGMAKGAVSLLSDPVMHKRFARAGLERVRRHFCAGRVVPQYEAYYQEVIRTFK